MPAGSGASGRVILRLLWRSAAGGRRGGFLEGIAATIQMQSETIPNGQEKKSTRTSLSDISPEIYSE